MTDRFLSTNLRRALERDIKAARKVAEDGVTDAIRRLGVADTDAPAHLSDGDKAIRRRLRAHARALGDTVTAGLQAVDRLIEAAAYAQWHRRLFARFLAERNLLRHPDHAVPVTLEEVEELATEEGFADGWSAAEAYAARMLPAVFQPDDPVLSLSLAPEHALALRKLVLGLDAETFQTDDALGWTYQFWRALEKDRVNKAGNKIGARDLPAVTQLFTEPYMVKFLLHNTFGAWRAAKVIAAQPDLARDSTDEAALRAAVSPPGYNFEMLRFVRAEQGGSWQPAAGTFSTWPDKASAISALDPCCGSGHFLTEMLSILSALRADEEGLSQAEAVSAVLQENLFGLELDGRCVQIAAFAVALTAWRIGGFQAFGPQHVHVAWVGSPPPLDRSDFLALANGDDELRAGLAGLHEVFAQAPLLGSLIDPKGGNLMSPQRLGKIEPLLDRLVEKTRGAEPERAEGAVAAQGMAEAAGILARQHTMVVTNVPFLGRGKQDARLAQYLTDNEPDARYDLATAMISRSLRLISSGGTLAVVSPQYWLFQGSYESFRYRLLNNQCFNFVAGLGSHAFETITGEVVNVSLSIISKNEPGETNAVQTLDATKARNSLGKSTDLRGSAIYTRHQTEIKSAPDSRISMSQTASGKPLAQLATSSQGIKSGDDAAYRRKFWELLAHRPRWEYIQGTVERTVMYGGASDIVLWGANRSHIARAQGLSAHSKAGCAVTQMGGLPASIYLEGLFDSNVSAITTHDRTILPAIWSYISSDEYLVDLKNLEPSLKANNAVMVQVPFDLGHWQAIAATKFPGGLPDPYSEDPTQWLFHGYPAEALKGTQLHVALARLCGYRWPAESDPDIHISAEARALVAKAGDLPEPDADGVLPLPAVATERNLAERLREYLNAAMPGWDEARLVREADEYTDKKAAKDQSLEGWLRDRAFRQHSALFNNRPFLWHISDGQKDGFSAFLHYHRLDHALLQKLTYTLLGAWITRRQAERDDRRVEAATILQKTLEAILVGEEPYDIFVRWKSLALQPIGWNPDLNDGVRMNIRPWIEAGVLTGVPKGIKWGVDRGKDGASAPWFGSDKGERNNDRHTKLADKREAREAAGAKAGAA